VAVPFNAFLGDELMQRDRLAPSAHGLWLTLVVAALASLGVGVLVALVGATAASAAERPTVDGRALSPVAGWHGRAVSAPAPLRVEGRGTPAGWSAGTVRRGDGRGLRRGSARVREVQRRLKVLGYHPGRADGVFTRRTQDAVAWFEYKHQLPVDGVVTVGTLQALRSAQDLSLPERRAQRRAQAQRADASRAGAPDAPRRAASAPQPDPGSESLSDRISGVAWWLWAALAAAVLAVVALVAWLLHRRRDRRPDEEGPVYELWVNGTSPDPAIGSFRGVVKAVSVPEDPKPAGWVADSQYLVADPTKPQPFWAPAQHIDELGAARQRDDRQGEPAAGAPVAIGYLAGPSEDEPSPGAAAIERACVQRGWRLAQIAHDERLSTAGTDRLGLAHAVHRLASGQASCLVVARMAHVASSVEDLASLLADVAEHDATLVVCDIDLDTSTTGGRRTANALAAINQPDPEPLGFPRNPFPSSSPARG
jgi:peptidoglycan hydrolase-like protein with peptidoglycan-binding domain